ncbi:hypothetical protein [Hydrogenivirga sp. 128-5-R1-1]|uniref:hypothetical protein n=1 Tax=Hydrogenivirga sp. 128-5-R1-1 TaxID=392423 RepID=UPI00015F3824|nr:hypothetical protein [Hydrogenivirga sp. 128-5-R1-1]EDP76543.1 hypothetical protein HG1285_03013 [Hydrogenivirga sp. 128-5-R1-1]
MNRWGKVLKALCQEADSRGLKLAILEADGELNWFGAGVDKLCSDENYSKSDAELYKIIKGSVSEGVNEGKVIAYVSPVNFQADIYEADRRRFATSNTSRPFGVTRDGFRVGFFESVEEAVDFFLGVAKRLREEGLSLHLHY